MNAFEYTYVQNIEGQTLATYSETLPLWLRYIDDTITATKKGDLNNNIAEHHLKTSHNINWYSATCSTDSTNWYQRITYESWFTNLEQTTLSRCQPLPTPYKRLLNRKQ